MDGVKANAEDNEPNPDSPEKEYNSFLINRGLSYFQDTIIYANEMNCKSYLPSRMQYDFLRNVIRPRRRFSKWFKGLDKSDDIKVIMKHYGYSATKARESLPLFNRDSLDRLHKKHDKGGSV